MSLKIIIKNINKAKNRGENSVHFYGLSEIIREKLEELGYLITVVYDDYPDEQSILYRVDWEKET